VHSRSLQLRCPPLVCVVAAAADHRGTPGAPGRTVTLEESPGAVCWGAAFLYEESPEEEARVMKVQTLAKKT